MTRYVVVGGGVAGVCCAEEICRLQTEATVTLVTPDRALKGVENVVEVTKHTEEFDLVERSFESVERTNLRIILGRAVGLDTKAQLLLLSDSKQVAYDRLCICAGATPKVIADSEHVVVLRDQDTVADLRTRLASARRVVIFGNGGIAMELVHALRGIEVIWAMKQAHVGDAFFDLDAASFLLTEMLEKAVTVPGEVDTKRQSLEEAGSVSSQASSSTSLPMSSFSPEQAQAQAFAQRLTRESPMLTVRPGSNGGGGLSRSSLRQQLAASSSSPPHSQPSLAKPPRASAAVAIADRAGRDRTAQSQAQPVAWPAGGSPPSRPQPEKGLEERCQHGSSSAALQRLQSQEEGSPCSYTMMQGRKNGAFGHAVGPKWTETISLHHIGTNELVVERNCEFGELVTPRQAEQQGVFDGRHWPVYVRLSNDKIYGADLVISAIGVQPNSDWLPKEVQLDADDGGILVDREMRTSVPNVWAAGDACSIRWPDRSPTWYQMRLWTQARLTGLYAAHIMAGDSEDAAFAFNFELFTHATRFLGKRVILLGLYNGQGLDDEPDNDIVTYSRTTEGPDATFVRVLLLRSKLMGAVLIGNTDYEEVFENLILDGLDLSSFGPDLLSPEIDLDQMFD